MELSNTYVKIDLDAIRENYRNLCQKAGVPVMAVVKADGYGHGAVAVAKALDNCPFFGVSSVAEALELRTAGITQPILILGHTHAAHYKTLVEQDIRPAIFNWEDAKALSEAAGEKAAVCHIAVDTGMSRIALACRHLYVYYLLGFTCKWLSCSVHLSLACFTKHNVL